MHLVKFLAFVLLICTMAQPVRSEDPMTFWDTPRKGGNAFNTAPQGEEYYTALAGTGATWVRLMLGKWQSTGRDFLLGNADAYEGLVDTDLSALMAELDTAHAAGLRVVLAPVTLPGTRWAQHNEGVYDDRLWSSAAFQSQAVNFWVDLATELKQHPAIVAYDILNEPAPERLAGPGENSPLETLKEWQRDQEGGTRDLRAFYTKVIAGIRAVDDKMPIMVGGGWFANPRSLAAWPAPLSDNRVIYAFHMYEPYAATSAGNMRRDKPLRYPGVKTFYDGQDLAWDRQAVKSHVDLAYSWAAHHRVPLKRVVASEFGCMRRWKDCGSYLTDVLDAVEDRNGHWAFYAFREDEWDGMDYELPASLRPGRFYYLKQEGKAELIPRNGELMELLQKRMKAQ